MCEENLAWLLPNGEWDVAPDLRGSQLRAVSLSDSCSTIFCGNEWTALPPNGRVKIEYMELFLGDSSTKIQERYYHVLLVAQASVLGISQLDSKVINWTNHHHDSIEYPEKWSRVKLSGSTTIQAVHCYLFLFPIPFMICQLKWVTEAEKPKRHHQLSIHSYHNKL